MPNGYSLHIGINEVDPNHYAGWSGKLVACEYDAIDMKSIAANSGYQTTMLHTEDATREKVIANIRAAATAMTAKDIFFLSFSGHGGQITDVNNDEVDRIDETWCLFDGQLIDDELFRLYASFPTGSRILVLSDSCHSGTVVRAFNNVRTLNALQRGVVTKRASNPKRLRFMPREMSVDVYRKNKAAYDRLQKKRRPKLKATVQLISGCQDNQYSEDGDYNGVFTAALLDVWSSGSFDGDYMNFHRKIAQKMPVHQSPNHLVFGGSPDDFREQAPFQI